MKKTKIPEQSIEANAKKMGEAELSMLSMRILIKHASDKEKDELRGKILLAAILETKAQEIQYRKLYDEHIRLMNRVDDLEKKLKRKIKRRNGTP